MVKICICGTIYSFFLYLIINKEWKNSIYFFPEYFDFEIVEGLKSRKINLTHIKKNKKIKYLPFYKVFYKLYIIFKMKMYQKKYKNIEIYGHDHIEETQIFWSKFFDKNPFYLLEDGIANYRNLELVVKHSKGFNHLLMGYSERIKKIYLTGQTKIPNDIAHKVELIDICKEWNGKTKEEQKDILDLFNISIYDIEKVETRPIWLLTQNFFGCGILSREEQIKLYTIILENYNYKDIIIKRHPLDDIDYTKYFQGVYVIEKAIPFEIFVLILNNIKKVITINSSGVSILDKKIEREYYNFKGEKIKRMINEEEMNFL